MAAHELQYHVALITGAKLPIVTDDAAVQGVRILVGESAATQALGLTNDDFGPQEYLISLRPNLLVLMGRDQDDRQPFDYANHQTYADVFDAQATCYAVYDFLERFCGVRWYLPLDADLGIVYTPSQDTDRGRARRAAVPGGQEPLADDRLSVPAGPVRRQPQTRSRRFRSRRGRRLVTGGASSSCGGGVSDWEANRTPAAIRSKAITTAS